MYVWPRSLHDDDDDDKSWCDAENWWRLWNWKPSSKTLFLSSVNRILGVSRQPGRCIPKSRSSTHVWSLRPLLFSLQHPSGYVTWTSEFNVWLRPQTISCACKQTHLKFGFTELVSEIHRGTFWHPCLDSTQFFGLRETCEFRFSMWMRCQPSWSSLSQLNRFGFRTGQPWMQMFDSAGPEWFVGFRPPPLTLMFLFQFDQYHAWHICGGREMHAIKLCSGRFLKCPNKNCLGTKNMFVSCESKFNPATQEWKTCTWDKVEGRDGGLKPQTYGMSRPVCIWWSIQVPFARACSTLQSPKLAKSRFVCRLGNSEREGELGNLLPRELSGPGQQRFRPTSWPCTLLEIECHQTHQNWKDKKCKFSE